jgi:hairy and enhancer of split, invertebrate
LEKADILEMTVKYLQNHQINLQRQQAAMSQAADATMASKFKAGFTECTNEVSRYPGIETQVKRRLLQHLHHCINGNERHHEQQFSQVQFLPSPPSSPEQDTMSHLTSTPNGYFLSNNNSMNSSGVQLIPTKLANGNIAFVVPQSPSSSQQLPILVPLPSRTASTGSANSSSYERLREQSTSPYNHQPPSPANSSYESSMEHYQQHRSYSPSSAPISLVMRKVNYDQQMKDDDKMWRPW